MDIDTLRVLGCNAPTLRSGVNLSGYRKTKAVVIKFPKDTNLKDMVRIVGSYPYDSDGESGDGDPVPQPPEGGEANPTILDTDLTGILDTDKTRARFVVILRDPQLSFLKNGQAITAGNAAGEKMFVNLQVGTTVGGKPRAVFHCIRDGNAEVVGHFNIGLMIADSGYYLPIVIDPKVKNRG